MMLRARLKQLGLELPTAGAPGGNYVPATRDGRLLFISGQIPKKDGKPHFIGQVGRDLSVEDAQKAASLSALNILAVLDPIIDGDLTRVVRCLKLTGFIACAPDFTQQSLVMNGASDLMAAVLGEKGHHARTSVGVSALPQGAAVEVEAIFSLAE